MSSSRDHSTTSGSALEVLDLFSGIGGFSLGLERAGMKTVAFCEIEPYCQAVLRKHWPHVPCYEDIKTLTGERLQADGIAVDVICGGFPCQDISQAGLGVGINGERSGLWSEYARLVSELRPRYVIVENVSALLGRGLGRVLGDLAAIGYDAEWHCIPASAVGAYHRRDRLWLVAHPDEQRPQGRVFGSQSASEAQKSASRRGEAVSDPKSTRQPSGQLGSWEVELRRGYSRNRGNTSGVWYAEPDVGRVAHGVPSRVDRLRALGNAVVPQIPEMIGRAILSSAKPLVGESSQEEP